MEFENNAAPEWDNSSEYTSISGADFKADVQRVSDLLSEGARLASIIEKALYGVSAPVHELFRSLLTPAQEASRLAFEAQVLLSNLITFVECVLSVDAGDQEARGIFTRLQRQSAKCQETSVPLRHLELLLSEALFQEYIKDAHVARGEFILRYRRAQLSRRALPVAEEKLIEALMVDGFQAWSNLYTNIAGTLRCTLRSGDWQRTVGLSEVQGLLQKPDQKLREAAWRGMNEAWTSQEEAASSILNALAGFRHEVNRRRSYSEQVHFLDSPLFMNRIKRSTLDTLMSVAAKARPIMQKAVLLCAAVQGQKALHPWDLFAPPPERALRGFELPQYTIGQGLAMIKSAFAQVSPEMEQFVSMMISKRWVEARVLSTKRPGAYCSSFEKSRTPRVFMSYMGGMKDLKTFAHELGHALHDWVARDLPLEQTAFPMTLAETASNFAEMTVASYLEREASSDIERFVELWQSVQDAVVYMVNIPARFEFENSFYEQRPQRSFSADDFRLLMSESWRKWYGDSLSEMDPMFWASKLHFHGASLGFYNFPYLFGYLFSQGIYAERERLGSEFYPKYMALLRDTGRMTAEEVAQKHLGADLSKEDFWLRSVAIVKRKVDEFERVMGRLL